MSDRYSMYYNSGEFSHEDLVAVNDCSLLPDNQPLELATECQKVANTPSIPGVPDNSTTARDLNPEPLEDIMNFSLKHIILPIALTLAIVVLIYLLRKM